MDNKDKFVIESQKIKKTREKIKQQLDEIEKKITPHALRKKTEEIHRWIANNAHHRVILKEKNISLFDENQNSARLSQCVKTIFKKIQSDSAFFKYVKKNDQ